VTIPTFTAGAVLTASQMNQVAKQVVVTCTSGTRPTSPPEGMTIYETDTDKMLTYTTATTGWVPPWNLPWGYVTAVKASVGTSSIGSSAKQVDGLSATWTAVANRIYRVTVHIPVISQSTNDGFVIVSLRNSGGSTIYNRDQKKIAASWDDSATIVHYETGLAAGSTTRTAYVETSAGSAAIAYSSSIVPLLLVEDIGPNGTAA
jgi:hypothetical protein